MCRIQYILSKPIYKFYFLWYSISYIETRTETKNMFDSGHISYMLISAAVSALLLLLMCLFPKSERGKVGALRFFAVITVLIYYSILWVDYFTTGAALVEQGMILPIFPCHICMWLLLIVAFWKRRDGRAYRILTEFTFWAGSVCGTIGILFNYAYAEVPDLSNYYVLKGLLSHSTMIVGCLYLALCGMVKIRVRNVLSVMAGLALFIVDGAVINWLYDFFELPPVNAMYLVYAPFENLPWLTSSVVGLSAVLVTFILTALYEQIVLPKNERWYRKIFKSKKKSPT